MFPPEKMVTWTHFFANRVIYIWNSLPDHIVASPSIACFKRKLSKSHFNE